MELLEDGVVAFLAAVGVTALVWLAVSFWTRRRKALDAWLLLPARGAGETLAFSVHELEEIRLQMGRQTQILVVDCGLTPEGKHILEILCREDDRLIGCAIEELEKMLR